MVHLVGILGRTNGDMVIIDQDKVPNHYYYDHGSIGVGMAWIGLILEAHPAPADSRVRLGLDPLIVKCGLLIRNACRATAGELNELPRSRQAILIDFIAVSVHV